MIIAVYPKFEYRPDDIHPKFWKIFVNQWIKGSDCFTCG